MLRIVVGNNDRYSLRMAVADQDRGRVMRPGPDEGHHGGCPYKA